MRKNLLLTLVLALTAFGSAFAQDTIPNKSFDYWTQISGGTHVRPDNWDSLAGGGAVVRFDSLQLVNNTTKDTTYVKAQTGKHFLGLRTALVAGQARQAAIVSTFGLKRRPAQITLNYMYFPGSSNQRAAVFIRLYKSNQITSPILNVNVALGASTAWRSISIDIPAELYQSGIPDSAQLILASDAVTGTQTVGTLFCVDNIEFGATNVSVAEVENNIAGVSNYPNPFSNTTTIAYELKKPSQVSLKVYDIAGREVQSLVNGTQSTGKHLVEFNGANLSEGVYIYQLRAGDAVTSGKMIINK